MNRILTLIDKEWAEMFKNRIVLFTIVLLPLLFTALPLVFLFATRSEGAGGISAEVPSQMFQACRDLKGAACLQVVMLNQFMVLFMLLPLAIPAAIAAYSIVGEKTTRSLEPLLATPISTGELIIGKALSAAIPAIFATWAAFALFMLGAFFLATSPEVMAHVLDAQWLIAIFIVGPLMAVAAVNVSVIVSSRVSDPRTAEQVSMLLIVPVMGLFFGQIANLFVLDANLIILIGVGVLLLDIALVYVGVGLFQRETILTKWK